MNAAELSARLNSLAAGGLKGRHAYGVNASVDFDRATNGVTVRAMDGTAWLAEHEWPRGLVELRRAVAPALADAIETLAAGASGPLLIVVDHADPVIGELETLTPLYERFIGDDRMLIFRCAAPVRGDILEGTPSQLSFRSNAALNRLAADFGLPTIEAP